MLETVDEDLSAGNGWSVTSLAGGGRLVFIRRKIIPNVTGVVEINAGAPFVRILGEFRVPFGKAGELGAMTNLTLGFGEMSNIKIFAVMFLVAGRASQIA